MAKMYLSEVIVMLMLPFYVAAQRYMLESQPSYLNGVKVCPVTVNITCRADRVLVLRWIAEQDGTLVEFASHSGNINDVYQINRPDWTSIQYAQPAIMAYANSEFDVNATISIPLSYMIDESISRIFCASSVTSRSESFIANATIISPPPPPQFIRCCAGKPMNPMGFITCNHTSPNEIYVDFPLLPNVDMYTVNYDEHLLSTDCLNNQFVSPNMRCKFMQQNKSTEYSFSIRGINCNNQESQSSNFTLITGREAPQDIIISRNYVGDLSYSVAWKVSKLECSGIPYTFVVDLQNETGQVLESRDITCMTKDCSVQIQVPPTDEKYRIQVSATDNQGNPLLDTSKTSQLLDGFSSNTTERPDVKFLPCYNSVMCISRLTGSCEFYITQGGRNITSGTGSVNSSIRLSGLNRNTLYFYIANVTTTESISLLGDNFTTIEYDMRMTDTNFGYFAFGLAFLVASFVLLLISIYFITKHKHTFEKLMLWRPSLICLAIGISLGLVLIFWYIAVGVVVARQPDTCDSSWQSTRDGLIWTAFLLSLLNGFLGVVVNVFYCIGSHSGSKQQDSHTEIVWETHDVKTLHIDERGISAAEKNTVQGHKMIGEHTSEATLRVKVQITKAVKDIKETSSNVYDTTEHAGMIQNKTTENAAMTQNWEAQSGSAKYSMLNRAKNVVKPQDTEYSPLQHNTARPPDRASAIAGTTTSDVSGASAAQYGQLNRENGGESPGRDSTVTEQHSSEREYASPMNKDGVSTRSATTPLIDNVPKKRDDKDKNNTRNK